MPRKVSILLVGMFIFALLASCASTRVGQGKALMKKDQNQEAIKLFLLELRDNPENPEAWRELGVAYQKVGEDDKALQAFSRANKLNPSDGNTLFYLGAAYEKQKKYAMAIEYYRQYTRLSKFSKTRKKIEARLEWLTRLQMQEEAKAAIQNERNIDVASIPENTVAVLAFQNLSKNPELAPLGKGLAEMMITDLSQARTLKVVERVKMQKLLEEMGLGMSGVVDEKTAPRVGKLLGSSRLVKGAYLDLDNAQIRLDAGIVGTRSGDFRKTPPTSGQMEALFRLEKNLVFTVIDQMGIPLTKEEREAIQYIPTESLLAFLAYSKGLDYEDRGMYDQAQTEYKKALSIDPKFKMAQQRKEMVELREASLADISTITTEFVETPGIAPQPAAPSTLTQSRLEASTVKLDAGFVPGLDSRQPVQEESNTATFGSGVEVEINIPIPHQP